MIGFRPRIALFALIIIAIIIAIFYSFRSEAATNWPLKVSTNGRYLVDQNNKPFFYAADTAWTLTHSITLDSAKQVIDIRKNQGFTAIQVSMLGFDRTKSGPQGTPFQNGDVTKPNEAFFAHVDQVLQYAQSKDMVLMLGLLWMSDNGGRVTGELPSESELTAYATYIGTRYKNVGNIIWFVGGDDDPNANVDAVKTLGRALKAADPNHLITFHTRNKGYNLKDESWLDFYSIQWNSNSPPYSYEDVSEGIEISPIKPILDMEPAYEPSPCCGTDPDTTPLKNRRNGWWAILSGSLGVVYGGPNDTWNAKEPINLDSYNRTAPSQTGIIQKILSQYPWEKLVPDNNNQIVTAERGNRGETDYVTAGRSSDGSLIAAYTPSARSLTVNMSQLSAPANAVWFDPTNGTKTDAGTNLANSGSKSFSSPGNNASGDSDFVLIIATTTSNLSPTLTVTDPTPTNVIPTYNCLSETPCTPSATPDPLITITVEPTELVVPSDTPEPTMTQTVTPIPNGGNGNNKNIFVLFIAFLLQLLQILLGLFRH